MSFTDQHEGRTYPWLAYLDEEYTSCEEGTLEHDLAVIIRNLLLSNDDAAQAAQRIDAYYWQKNLDSGPLFKFQKDWGILDFLEFVYEIVLDMALRLPHDDNFRQDALVQFIVELRRIPPKSFTRWNGNRLVDPDDDLFAVKLDDRWGGYFAGDGWMEKLGPSEWKERCDRWVNFSSFLARCIQTRLDDHVADMTKYPRMDIPEGLEKEHPQGVKRDCMVMVAAQYILLSVQFIDEELVIKPDEGRSDTTLRGSRRWRLWADKLKGMCENKNYELAPGVRTAVHKAHAELISRHPEFFEVSEGGSKVGS